MNKWTCLLFCRGTGLQVKRKYGSDVLMTFDVSSFSMERIVTACWRRTWKKKKTDCVMMANTGCKYFWKQPAHAEHVCQRQHPDPSFTPTLCFGFSANHYTDDIDRSSGTSIFVAKYPRPRRFLCRLVTERCSWRIQIPLWWNPNWVWKRRLLLVGDFDQGIL